MNKIYLGFGSNLGDREKNIKQAISFFIWDDRFSKVRYSSLYETKPFGVTDQPNFLNSAAVIETSLTANDVLKIVMELEKRVGRTKSFEWGPREIDIDILLYNDEIIEENDLIIPHKDLLTRDFALAPLVELDEKLLHPIEKKMLISFLSELDEKYIISKRKFTIELENK